MLYGREASGYTYNFLKVATEVDKVEVVFGTLTLVMYLKVKDITLQPYKTLPRPHLKYCALFWSPNFKGRCH